VIVIRNEPRLPFHSSLSYDNQGDPNTGRHQTGATFSFDNPIGFNDFFSVTHRESTPGDEEHKFSGSDSFLYNIPFGYSTVTLGKSRSRYVTTIQVPSGLELVSSGNSTISFAKLDRVVYRDQVSRATLGATLTTKESRNFLADQLLQVSSRKLTLLDLDASLATRVGNAALQIDAGITQGLDSFGALEDPSGLPAISPRAQFLKHRLGVSLILPFKFSTYDAMFSSQWAGQHSGDVLFGSEQLLIGSLYTVRGFVRNTLSGERGYYGRNELSMRFPVKLGESTVAGRAFVALDLGEVYSRAPGTPSGRLAGSAIGFSFAWHGAVWEWFHTRPISGPSSMSLESPQTWFRVSFAM
jgi:hemolysin activation/secretion protein